MHSEIESLHSVEIRFEGRLWQKKKATEESIGEVRREILFLHFFLLLASLASCFFLLASSSLSSFLASRHLGYGCSTLLACGICASDSASGNSVYKETHSSVGLP